MRCKSIPNGYNIKPGRLDPDRVIFIKRRNSMHKVKLTITECRCRDGHFKTGDEFIVENLCPPICCELWAVIYPYVFALQNGADLDYGDIRAKMFDAKCPDGGRVAIHGEVVEE